ncbi:hypothetical protein ACFXAZ_04535 [Streptomyces sp. NPDC059477]|uniref:hypothetical protein n=1 Tax=Streptomyces sp. NPDC059477 TaxID=3346847 RepID=UPI00367F3E78
MADEHFRWLDRETVERLLRGEPLEALDDDARDQADRLAQALGALSPPTPLTSEELPGEAAALAAFRKARADLGEADCPFTGDLAAPRTSDAGLIRIGGRSSRRGNPAARGDCDPVPRRGRQLRLGLAAALAVVMIGGISAAAATGVLPTPFDDKVGPGPAATVPTQPPTGAPASTPSPTPAEPGQKSAPPADADPGSVPQPGKGPSTAPSDPVEDTDSDAPSGGTSAETKDKKEKEEKEEKEEKDKKEKSEKEVKETKVKETKEAKESKGVDGVVGTSQKAGDEGGQESGWGRDGDWGGASAGGGDGRWSGSGSGDGSGDGETGRWGTQAERGASSAAQGTEREAERRRGRSGAGESGSGPAPITVPSP